MIPVRNRGTPNKFASYVFVVVVVYGGCCDTVVYLPSERNRSLKAGRRPASEENFHREIFPFLGYYAA